MTALQSKQGLVILVSEENPPITNVFRLTLNRLVGKEIFPADHTKKWCLRKITSSAVQKTTYLTMSATRPATWK